MLIIDQPYYGLPTVAASKKKKLPQDMYPREAVELPLISDKESLIHTVKNAETDKLIQSLSSQHVSPQDHQLENEADLEFVTSDFL